MKFIDETSFILQSGKGGSGCSSFRRETFVPRGGPDGGDGGRGGDVILRVNPRLNSLIDLHHKRKLAAKNGQPGQGQNMTGKDGEDLIVEIPPGTVVRNENEILADLSEGEVVLLKGGRGGKGNSFFKTSVNQAPTHFQPGEPGESEEVFLELKLIADIGLIGFPNVGKSTLISSISAAKPKIADYPFTTLTPNLGVVRFGDGESFVVADIPGLISGAHEGVGLGIQFLRHIERTRAFVHLIDVGGMSGRDPWQDYLDINKELEMYDKKFQHEEDYQPLMDRKQIVCFNKADITDSEQIEDLKARFTDAGVEVRVISAVARYGLNDLVNELGSLALEQR